MLLGFTLSSDERRPRDAVSSTLTAGAAAAAAAWLTARGQFLVTTRCIVTALCGLADYAANVAILIQETCYKASTTSDTAQRDNGTTNHYRRVICANP